MLSIYNFLKITFIESTKLYWDLLKIMLPVMLIVRIGTEFGLVAQIGKIFAPLMGLIGLPAEMGLVWAASAILGVYGAAIMLFGLLPDFPLSVAQLTIICSIILMCHSLPIEQRIVQKAGVSFTLSTIFRLGATFLYAWILYKIYDGFEILQEIAVIAWLPEASDDSWLSWLQESAITLFWIFWIILALLLLLRLMDILKITKMLTRIISPALRLMGIGENSAPLAMVGVLLGLTYGGGLIIKQARAGHLKSRSVFLTMAFMILSHSMIEDTLFIYAIGGDLSGILIGRIIFTFVIMIILGFIIWRIPDPFFYKWLYKKPH